ncbi:MAG: hypothetical protein E6R03_14730 [Hyphomicrobiaceae bacterium]|nr:MAG: hypothetical protein E6R03_14730 [Hyphomicrobiaceae bacterium]
MKHVTVEDLESLVWLFTSKREFCRKRAGEEFDKGNFDASNQFMARADAHYTAIDCLQSLIRKEKETP